jgi:glycosyltransferase involved in cell wall biosynthesis
LIKNIITVAVPTYNRAVILTNTLSKILKNECQYDVLVVDNHSSDETELVCKGFQEKFDNFKYFKQTKNLGYDVNVLTCLELVQTEYVWFLSDDDNIDGELISSVIDIILKFKPDGILVNAEVIDSVGGRKIIDNLGGYDKDELIKVDSDSLVKYAKWSTLISSQILRKDLALNTSLKKFIGTCFVQIPMFWDTLYGKKLYILSSKKIKKYDSATHDFNQSDSKLWFVNWNYVLSQLSPSFIVEDKVMAITSLYSSGLFNKSGVLAHLVMSLYNYDVSKKEYREILKNIQLSNIEKLVIYIIINLIPQKFIEISINLVKKLKA